MWSIKMLFCREQQDGYFENRRNAEALKAAILIRNDSLTSEESKAKDCL